MSKDNHRESEGKADEYSGTTATEPTAEEGEGGIPVSSPPADPPPHDQGADGQ